MTEPIIRPKRKHCWRDCIGKYNRCRTPAGLYPGNTLFNFENKVTDAGLRGELMGYLHLCYRDLLREDSGSTGAGSVRKWVYSRCRGQPLLPRSWRAHSHPPPGQNAVVRCQGSLRSRRHATTQLRAPKPNCARYRVRSLPVFFWFKPKETLVR